ncbi:hypothetical protein TNCV_1784701 [Trichonephila clavipes]|nr:hypothetical protein TNCV_1784701 [Trichonephila clavipes]
MKPSNSDAEPSSNETMGRRGRSRPHSCDDKWIMSIVVMDRECTSRTKAQQIQSVTHHSAFTRSIRRRLQPSGLSARHQLRHRFSN